MSRGSSLTKILDGDRLSPEEALALYRESELTELAMLAGIVRQRFHDDGVVTYIIDRNINPTNVCITDCGFCAFYRRPGDTEAYVLERDVIYEKIDELRTVGGIQLLLQGGHHPYLKTDWFASLFRDIKDKREADLTAAELHAVHHKEKLHWAVKGAFILIGLLILFVIIIAA